MYHPAVALYNGELKDVLVNDFKRLQMFLEGKLEVKQNTEIKKEKFSKTKQTLINDLTSL